MSGVLFVAPFPPVYHGQAISSEHLANWLEQEGIELTRQDTNARNKKPVERIVRFGRLLRASAACFMTRHSTVYLSVSANKGMWITTVMAALARLRKRKVLLHHHTNAHLAAHRLAAKALVRAAGPQAKHIVICEDMRQNLLTKYGNELNCLCLSNVGIVSPPSEEVGEFPPPPYVLGHLSNLTVEKGCLRAIRAFKAAHSLGLASQLVLAGPVEDPELEKIIQAEVTATHGAINSLGAVYGSDKTAFFKKIDVFLFPSQYSNETQGIVNLEALAAGNPVVAFGQCCITSDLSESKAGIVVPQESEFDMAVVQALQKFSTESENLSEEALKRFKSLEQSSAIERKMIASEILLEDSKTRERGASI